MTGGRDRTAVGYPDPLDRDRAEVISTLRSGPHLLCCLDFDGTLAPIVDDPDEATLPPGTEQVLARLHEAPDVTVAIVSGRSVLDLRSRVELPVTLVGNHGLERLDRPSADTRGSDRSGPTDSVAGASRPVVHPLAAAAIPRIEACAATLETVLAPLPNVRVESKRLTGTVHYRTAPAPVAQLCRRLTVDVVERVGDERLSLSHGDEIVEFGPAIEWGKGDAVELLRSEQPSGTRVLVCGDDTTDEDAFRSLRRSDVGVRVGERTRSAAQYRTESPSTVRAFLDRLAGSISSKTVASG
ncbi:trehalose-phosphatase [Halovivax ruber XH-70]|uniref:Trehalose 6-phosphate phosphatase n=1 Tax=Halovivax ruber (strain DSM 18193 / JCM 13892 / XH-70) TaxID=797302 RepID=L0IDU0_HALRX|nr:trehalose-phosphatase [Halovivax ruber]AGB16137.1 trehalose-phosphatase [Halovivax ruber XH-70]